MRFISFFSSIFNFGKILSRSLSNETFWAAVSAIIASTSVIFLVRDRSQERLSRRPYLAFKARVSLDSIETEPDYKKLTYTVVLENVGIRPALDIDLSCQFIPTSLNKNHVKKALHSMAGDLPKGLQVDSEYVIKISNNEESYYMVLSVSYSDGVSDEKYSQTYTQSWLGMADGKQIASKTFYVQKEEMININKFFNG